MSRGLGHLADRVALALVNRARQAEARALRESSPRVAPLPDLTGELRDLTHWEPRPSGRPGYDDSTAGLDTPGPVPPGWLQ